MACRRFAGLCGGPDDADKNNCHRDRRHHRGGPGRLRHIAAAALSEAKANGRNRAVVLAAPPKQTID